MTLLSTLKKELKQNTDPKKAKISKRFFKTGKGEYGEGDIFLGINVPTQRKIAQKYLDLTLNDLQELLSSKIHEHRFTALIIIVEKYKKSGCGFKKNNLQGSNPCNREIFDFYIKNAEKINNWDLVDVSAPYIVGDFLLKEASTKRKILYDLAKSNSFWKKRIAIVSTFSFIRAGQFEDTLKISEILLKDKHDLIHKAVGWMLREVGKRDQNILEKFLIKNYKKISRTTLRYTIERFPEDLRQKYLKNNLN